MVETGLFRIPSGHRKTYALPIKSQALFGVPKPVIYSGCGLPFLALARKLQ
jgi:hypothetical protein